ncbi:antibiotic biosynthesis monooxygenase family protein [Bosea sp. RAF48]|uniref:antibiotic biosynthesis monooxygenase family protein n=1 Tax=Bosea sp. RAF48 TaxID=3237480 RepID=UPI003F91B5BF
MAKTDVLRRAVLALGFAGNLIASVPSRARTKGTAMETKMSAAGGSIALVNVFTVQPADQPRLAEILREGTEDFFSKQPGSLSSSVLVGRDGRRVVNYSRWRSADDIAAFRETEYFKAYLARIGSLATVETMLCDVGFSHG